jgi:hypothetical protein
MQTKKKIVLNLQQFIRNYGKYDIILHYQNLTIFRIPENFDFQPFCTDLT